MCLKKQYDKNGVIEVTRGKYFDYNIYGKYKGFKNRYIKNKWKIISILFIRVGRRRV